MTKLTKAQKLLLEEIDGMSVPVSQSYKPALRLVELGYAEWEASAYSDFLSITEAGHAAISKAQKGDTP